MCNLYATCGVSLIDLLPQVRLLCSDILCSNPLHDFHIPDEACFVDGSWPSPCKHISKPVWAYGPLEGMLMLMLMLQHHWPDQAQLVLQSRPTKMQALLSHSCLLDIYHSTIWMRWPLSFIDVLMPHFQSGSVLTSRHLSVAQ